MSQSLSWDGKRQAMLEGIAVHLQGLVSRGAPAGRTKQRSPIDSSWQVVYFPVTVFLFYPNAARFRAPQFVLKVSPYACCQ